MKITFYRHSLKNRGGDYGVLSYATLLCERGYDIELWVNEINTFFYIHPKIRIRRIPRATVIGSFLFARFHKFDTDVLIIDLVILAFLVYPLNKGKIIYFAQGYDISYFNNSFFQSIMEYCYKKSLSQYDIKTIAVSDQLVRQLQKYLPKNIYLIPNGVDLKTFYFNPKSSFFHEKGNKIIIMLYARKDFPKGLDIGVKALKKLLLKDSNPNISVWTIGPEEIKLENFNVKNYGNIKSPSELKDILSATDIFLMPSRSEGLSLLLLQALACECCVVATEACNIIQHEVNGLLSPVEDCEDLATNLIKVIGDKPLRARLRKNARTLAEKYSLEESFTKFEKILQELKSNK